MTVEWPGAKNVPVKNVARKIKKPKISTLTTEKGTTSGFFENNLRTMQVNGKFYLEFMGCFGEIG